MTTPQTGEPTLRETFAASGLSLFELWVRYTAAGGQDTPARLRHHVESDTCPDPAEHELVATALGGAPS